MRKKRVLSPQHDDTSEAFIQLIQPSHEVFPEEDEHALFPHSPPPSEEIEAAPSLDSVDEYLHRQVMQEMYGIENPSYYERTLLALKKRL